MAIIYADIQSGATIDASVSVNQTTITSAPSTWADMVVEYEQGYPYALPTGASTSYRTGDDKNIEDTIFAAARVANKLKVFNTLASFLVLNNNNTFGNTNRFTDSVGGQDYDGTAGSLVDYIIDHYTGLGHFALGTSYGGTLDWDGMIDDALGATEVGFSDYFLSNWKQAASLFDGDTAGSMGYIPFSLGASTAYMYTSSSLAAAKKVYFRPRSGQNEQFLFNNAGTGTGFRLYFYTRKHF